MNKSSSSQHQANPQIILAHGPAPDQPSIEHDTSYVNQNKNLRQRTNSTENTKYLFNNHERSSLNRNAAGGNNQLTFQSSSETNNQSNFPQKQPQRGQVSSSANYQNMIQKDISIYGGAVFGEMNDKSSEKQYSLQQRQQRGLEMASPGGEYQSILLTRYLKEPKLPPSSTYYNNLSRKKKSTAGASRGSQKPQPGLTQNAFGGQIQSSTQYKECSSPSKLINASEASKSRKRAIGFTGQATSHTSNVISYRNQKEIMRKIFGNEQNYHQVKNLLVKGPYSTEENSNVMQKTFSRPQDSSKSPLAQKSTNYVEYQRQHSEKPQINQLHNNMMDRRQANPQSVQRQVVNQTPPIGPDENYLAKSIKKDSSSAKFGESTTIGAPSQANNLPSNSTQQLPMHSDQVEKAIFDLQDVKNNYFQEKTTYDQKIQQIQTKTMTNGFGLLPNSTAYNKTSTSGFLPPGQRPLTQGGNLLRNQQLMNDNNILKGDLEQVSKEDLKERLVVAEMVMKKLFQRNKDLEDQMQAQKEAQTYDSIRDTSRLSQQQQNKRLSLSNIGSPKNLTELNNLDITTNDEGLDKRECHGCVKLSKELVLKEKDYQERINELQQQLLKKTEVMGKSSHLEYLQIRLEETMSEAKRHFSNYINARDTLTLFMESRLNQTQIQGGVKGQKIHNDILNVLKKNLEVAEQALYHEKDQLKLSYSKNQAQVLKKDAVIKKKDAKIKSLSEEIERRKFIESKVQRYVKGLISKNQRHSDFLNHLITGKQSNLSEVLRREIEGFQRELEIETDVGGQDGGESTENEEENEQDGNESLSNRNISVEVNDL